MSRPTRHRSAMSRGRHTRTRRGTQPSSRFAATRYCAPLVSARPVSRQHLTCSLGAVRGPERVRVRRGDPVRVQVRVLVPGRRAPYLAPARRDGAGRGARPRSVALCSQRGRWADRDRVQENMNFRGPCYRIRGTSSSRTSPSPGSSSTRLCTVRGRYTTVHSAGRS